MAMFDKEWQQKSETAIVQLVSIGALIFGSVYGYGQGWLHPGKMIANHFQVQVALTDTACVKESTKLLAGGSYAIKISDLRDIRNSCEEYAAAQQQQYQASRTK
jgi:hypothetical protein